MTMEPEVRRTRKNGLPFVMIATRWTDDPRYSSNCRTLYAILAGHADTQTRDTARGKPYRKVLAEKLGVSLSTLDRTLVEMEVAGLLSITHRKKPGTSEYNDANLYELHDTGLLYPGEEEWVDPLPPDVLAADAAKTLIEERRATKRAAGIERRGGVPKGVNTRAKNRETSADADSSTHAAMGSSMGAALIAAPMLREVQSPSPEPPTPDTPAPSARSAAHARRAPDVRRREGGEAASGKPVTKPRGGRPPGRAPVPRVPDRVADAVVQALADLPAPLAQALGRELAAGLLPRRVEAAVGRALEDRSPAQLAERVNRRWITHGYQEAADPHTGTGLHRPLGVLLALIGPGPCPDPRCEDGASADTGAPCPRCTERREDRRAARRVPAQPRPAQDPAPASQEPQGAPGAQHAPPTVPAPRVGCGEHPGSGTRLDPATGERCCAGCWVDRRTAAPPQLTGDKA